VRFVNASASALPFRDGEFDVVIARLSLPYMHINRALCEARRVLRPGGRLWAALHPFQVPWEKVKRANWKGRVYFAYVMINSALFHWVQREISFPGGMRETFQTERGIRRALRTAGFSRVVREVRGGLKFAVTAFVD
jgi:ubiquinone/menaquinone biosynthesis C-methylase UbiE